ncbi:sigma-70 family RNA polymerase sigma factor [Chryseobacterium sp. ISL-6]|uniref:RNA polymerase sigma factor n=1 Tax=Chryseobacterium sp. ISL-6 TaxID=2819143 RepID=UPI001BE67F50|nr:sigma-70 family RNA polymerase sigma factor [Chryseobacterium sp. ISL-6]MBT2620489.1 sigma-70 family RNA polymerase sigma factor [Chryseobacterium sp. ISL-6]
MQTYDWQTIYINYSPKLLGICRRYIQDIYAAEDIVQDSFITAIQNKNQLRDEKLLFAWLKTIVVNNALQYIRKSSKETFITTEPSEIPDILSEMNHPSLDEKIFFKYDFTRDQLLSSIDNLPEHHKSVFNLFFIENHSHMEISGMLGITVNTSKSHLLRAKKSIQNYLLGNVDHHTPKNKKKITQLLVLFGFGGLLWAQTFRSKFLDYSIAPSKVFDISENISIKVTSPPMISSLVWKKKVVISSMTLLIIVVSIFIIKSNKNLHSKETSIITSDKTPDNEHKTIEITSQNLKKSSSSVDQPLEKALNGDNSQIPIVESQSTSEEKSIDSKEKSKKVILKDSIQNAPKKIIVVKKIIQRDTIFIER